jgi:DNA topoisomerase-1
VELNDRRLARIIQKCHDLPGYELFQYADEAGRVDSTDVNQYLKEFTGQEFTAKRNFGPGRARRNSACCR